MDIEKELRELRLWEFEMPSGDALASTAPFAVDTLEFTQWVQFIFIPRLYAMIEVQAALPLVSGIAPMAEEYFAPLRIPSSILISHFKRIDNLLSGHTPS